MGDITVQDALAVFSLEPSFTLDTLKKSYHAVALRVHPDRGGSEDLFRTVNECFRVLSLECHSRSGGAMHDQLKRDFSADVERFDSVSRKDNGFSLERFNSVYEETKVSDAIRDTGYGDWMQQADCPQRAPKLNLKTGNEEFNKAFESSVPVPESNSKSIVVVPVDLSCGSSLWLTELGIDSIDDLSSGNAIDCRVAFSTQRLAPNAASFSGEDTGRFSREKVEARRTAELAREMSEDEERNLWIQKQKEELLDATRRERELAITSRFEQAHERARRAMLSSQV